MADPIEAMATALRQSLETQDFVQGEELGSITLDGVFDLNELARAAWKLALDELDANISVSDPCPAAVEDYLDAARRGVLGG